MDQTAKLFAHIKHWIDESDGSSILIGPDVEVRFKRTSRYSEADLDSWEQQVGFPLPHTYRAFLAEVGAADLFIDEYGHGVRLFPLSDLRAYQQEVFSGRENPWGKLLVIGCLTNHGFLPAFLLGAPPKREFAVLSCDEDPEEWLVEAEWGGFQRWLNQLVSSLGEDDIPRRNRG